MRIGSRSTSTSSRTFGFFDGTLDELERSQQESDYQGLRDKIDPLVDFVIANGVYEVVASWTADDA